MKGKLSKERLEVSKKLVAREWFKSSEAKIKDEILNLPEDFNNFIKDLGDRPNDIGEVEILKIEKIYHGNYLVIPVFQVRSRLTNEVFSYEYVSWKNGRFPGTRGLILVEVDNQIKFFVMRKGNKFALAENVYDTIGTFYPKFSTGRLVHLPTKVEKQLQKQLGLAELNIKRYFDLGLVATDNAMTINKTAIYALVINGNEAQRFLKQTDGKHFDAKTNYEIEIHPIEQLLEYVTKSDDSYFLAIVARLAAMNVLKF